MVKLHKFNGWQAAGFSYLNVARGFFVPSFYSIRGAGFQSRMARPAAA
jgi:hypothetical protein